MSGQESREEEGGREREREKEGGREYGGSRQQERLAVDLLGLAQTMLR